jgi:hypothetical protein
MKLLAWNCRGLAQPSIVRSLQAFLRNESSDIVFLTKTKSARHVASPILRQLGYFLTVQAPPSNYRGGLLLAWKFDVNLSAFYVSNNIICAWYYSVIPYVKCLLSFVYGPPYKKTSSEFWTVLSSFGVSLSAPWLCIGDFNVIISQDDKYGGWPYNYLLANPFMDFINTFGMVDLGFSGNPYTWSNHHQGLGLIKERLDRSFASSDWICYFPSYLVSHLPAHNSDHYPFLLNTTIPVPTLLKPFRFEEFCTRDPTCEVVIQEAWSTPIEGSFSYFLSKKLKITKQSIKYWNKHYFGDICSKIDRTLKLLDAVQQDYPSDSNLALELHLHSLVDEYLLQEESTWKSKSR